MEYFVYIIRSKKDGSLYTGFTLDLKKRLERHNSAKVVSTKNKVPFEVVYFEASLSLKEALRREKYLKSSKAKNLKSSFRNVV
ncbi:MAG: GIY-YIG nuclease family protein [Candidatus Omnitrophica bacterium]|nr:GIY-YIG nuclease family protein [Patescibacteria group bacterium]MBU4467150.1 GIY-YIG nuclease family protein [Candidatus Omnitrophota bacterium]MCG2707331.1 GIY-YIG nuclease family protein [Candidatus Omnitrophota bacterium]